MARIDYEQAEQFIQERSLHWASLAPESAWHWYDIEAKNVGAMAREYGISHEQAAYIVAALSPRCPWEQNVVRARRLIESDGTVNVHVPLFQNAAVAILHGASGPEIVANWPKVSNFAPLLLHGIDWEHVAFDGIQSQLCSVTAPSARNYDKYKAAMIELGASIGKPACTIQSASWTAFRLSDHYKGNKIARA